MSNYLDLNFDFDEDSATQILKNTISPSRFKHTMGVVNKSVEYAKMLNADEHRVRIAALLHDCAKHLSHTQLIEYAKEHGYDITEDILRAPHLLHGPVGAMMAKDIYGVDDEKIFSIIAKHTLGSEGMSIEEKIVFLADYTEDGRRYSESANVRNLAKKDFDLAIIRCCDESIKHLLRTGAYIHPMSIITRNSLIDEYKQKNGEIK